MEMNPKWVHLIWCDWWEKQKHQHNDGDNRNT